MHEQLPPLVPTGKPKLPVQVTSLPGDRLTRVPPPPLRRCPVRLLPSSDRAPKYATVSGSSLGVPQRPPLHRHPRVRPLLGCPRAQGCHTLSSFRPCRSSRLRRFAPHTASQVCCTLQPVMGFAWFRAEGRLSPTTDPPPRRSFPLRSSSAEPAGPCHQGPSLRAVGRAACRSIPSSSTSRSCFRSGVPPLGVSAGARAPVGFPRPRLSPGPTVTGGTCGPPGGGQLPGALVRTSG
jgi:hypothetical protein